MNCGRRKICAFLASRTGSATTKLAVGAFAIVLAALIIGDELARRGHHNALSKRDIVSNAPAFQNRGVDVTPTGAIERPARTPCGEKDD
jgi:hypothetical protein